MDAWVNGGEVILDSDDEQPYVREEIPRTEALATSDHAHPKFDSKLGARN